MRDLNSNSLTHDLNLIFQLFGLIKIVRVRGLYNNTLNNNVIPPYNLITIRRAISDS